MGNALRRSLSSHELATALGLAVEGADRPIRCVAPLTLAVSGALCFSKQLPNSFAAGAVVIAPEGMSSDTFTLLVSERPRLDFARSLSWIKKNIGFECPSDTAVVHDTARIGIGCALGRGVTVGAETVIGNHVTISDGVKIGDRCIIKSGAVIGEAGFGFERDETGVPIRLVHLGSVRIGDDVEIGSCTSVCRGTLTDTVLEDHVKIDDHVHVAHNVILRRGCMVIACAELSGGVEIGAGAWVGPNASVIQKKRVGANSLVGIAANVLKDVGEGVVVVGNPAKPLSKA